MTKIKLIEHAPGAPGLRLFGLGPGLRPNQGLIKLKKLLNNHAFWAKGRSKSQLKSILKGSTVIVSLWIKNRMVGFGRATSDGISRAVLWDIVVAGDLQGQGLGKLVLQKILEAKALKKVERVYLMTTNSSIFYTQNGFKEVNNQKLMLRE